MATVLRVTQKGEREREIHSKETNEKSDTITQEREDAGWGHSGRNGGGETGPDSRCMRTEGCIRDDERCVRSIGWEKGEDRESFPDSGKWGYATRVWLQVEEGPPGIQGSFCDLSC